MFTTVLIANRGEIALRIIRTLRTMGVRTVAVYSEADAAGLHVEAADEAVCIGPAPVGQSYLRMDAVIAAAKATGAEAIHPGYGLLSESPAFARLCEAEGVVFIGPGPEAMERMADKAKARQIMKAAGVPVVPGSDGPVDVAGALEVAADIGFPLLVKAAGGGGGIGMTLVKKEKKLERALQSCSERAESAFGDATVYVERFLEGCRHVEVQLLFGEGDGVHLYERECSLQRRHQKVVEESPSPLYEALPPSRLEPMLLAAVAAGRAVGYRGVGTVEFIARDDGTFYFIEMNTRLQVEHPVTELRTGLDLVEWQLRVAAGEPLGFRQQDIAASGHAIECRLYAEDPRRRFLPSPGLLEVLELPDDARCDFGVRAGQTISHFYDPLLGKISVHGGDRTEAIAAMTKALSNLRVGGIATNAELLAALMSHSTFVDGTYTTAFLEAHISELLPPVV